MTESSLPLSTPNARLIKGVSASSFLTVKSFCDAKFLDFVDELADFWLVDGLPAWIQPDGVRRLDFCVPLIGFLTVAGGSVDVEAIGP